MALLPVTNGFYSLPSTSISNQKCVNLYTHVSEAPSETQEQLLGFSGVTELGDSGFGKTRGDIEFQNEWYRVDGETFIKIDIDNNVTNLGLITGFGRVSIAENGESICIVDPNGNSYFYDKDNGLQQITDADFLSFGRARSVAYSDGFFVFNTDKILFQSSIVSVNKGQNFNALEFDDADQFTDDLVRVIRSQGNLYAFGVESYEVYRLRPTSTTGEFAFQRVTVQNNERGLRGRFNIVDTDSALYFIGGGKYESSSVWELRGATPKKISTDAIDTLIEDEPTGFALAWVERGQFFRSFTFDTTTIVYNARTGRWCEQQENLFTSGSRIQTTIHVYGDNYVSDDTGKWGVMDGDVFTLFGDTVLDFFTTMPFGNNRKPFTVSKIEALCQAGVGNDEEENPSIAMSYSRDGGVTFTNERYKLLGRRGERQKRQVWRQIGRMDEDVVMRFAFSNPCRKAFIGLEATFI